MTYQFGPREIGSTSRPGNPEWVLVGCDVSDNETMRQRGWRVMVIASASLSEVELRVVSRDLRDYDYGLPPALPRFSSPVYTLTATMESLRDGAAVLWIAYGATYGEALAKVMGQWNPDNRSSHPALCASNQGVLAP